jgi:hypothetical protein
MLTTSVQREHERELNESLRERFAPALECPTLSSGFLNALSGVHRLLDSLPTHEAQAIVSIVLGDPRRLCVKPEPTREGWILLPKHITSDPVKCRTIRHVTDPDRYEGGWEFLLGSWRDVATPVVELPSFEECNQ